MYISSVNQLCLVFISGGIHFIVTVCVFVCHMFSYHPFYFDFHSAPVIFDVSSGFYFWNVHRTPTWYLSNMFKVAFKDASTKNSEPTGYLLSAKRNRNETKRNETKSTKTKRNEMKWNQQKRNETKRNQRNENEIKRNQRKQNEINENKTKYDARLLPTHVSVSFIRRGQDLITIGQEYYVFIQRESVLFT